MRAMPAGVRVGGTICAVCGGEETQEHVGRDCPMARELWGYVLRPFQLAVPGHQPWVDGVARALERDAPFDTGAKMALTLGLRPPSQQGCPEVFTLLRGLVLSTISRHRTRKYRELCEARREPSALPGWVRPDRVNEITRIERTKHHFGVLCAPPLRGRELQLGALARLGDGCRDRG